MAERSGAKLARIHRVRSIQLNLVQAAEADAQAKVASETALRSRIAQLAAGVEPIATAADGVIFAAAALYRERLQQSALAAEQRVANANADSVDDHTHTRLSVAQCDTSISITYTYSASHSRR